MALKNKQELEPHAFECFLSVVSFSLVIALVRAKSKAKRE
jgi:hypothetical protein